MATYRVRNSEVMKATVKAVIEENSTVKTIFLEAEKKNFVPGQFLMVYRDIDGRRTGRAYSISSPPSEDLSITFKHYSDGKISPYLWNLKEGDSIEIEYPYGHFKLEESSKPVFISGGTGIAPIRSMAHHCLEKGIDFKMIASFRNEEDLIFSDELEGLKCEIVLTSQRERISEKDLSKYDKDSTFYICGSPQMASSIVEILKNMGIEESRIKSEKW